jgi:GNAT superfamily N-acetyltransferase
MSDTNTRPATPDDIQTILRFVKDLARYEKAEHEVVATEETLARTLFGEPRYAEALIAEYRSEPVGFAVYFYSYSTWLSQPGLYLEDLYVMPQYRSYGAGKALLNTLARIALDRGCGRFEWSVLDWNEPAINFYERLGAEAQSEWIKYRLSGKSLTDLAQIS